MPKGTSAADSARWNQKFSGEEAKGVLQIVAEAAKILTTMNQFTQGEQPNAAWFPSRELWPELMSMQVQRDVATGVHLHKPAPLATRMRI